MCVECNIYQYSVIMSTYFDYLVIYYDKLSLVFLVGAKNCHMATRELRHNIDFLDEAVPVASNPNLEFRGDRYWRINNSSFSEYGANVEFPGYPGGLREILDQHIGRSEANVGLDLAGGNQGNALGDLLKDGTLGEGLVTNLSDMRYRYSLAHRALGHISGDLATKAVWDKIIGWQEAHAPGGLALIMHRPVGGLQDQPPQVYTGATHLLLDMLRPGGILLSQVPLPMYDPAVSRLAYRDIYTRPDVDKIVMGRNDRERIVKHIAVIVKRDNGQ